MSVESLQFTLPAVLYWLLSSRNVNMDKSVIKVLFLFFTLTILRYCPRVGVVMFPVMFLVTENDVIA